jgi:hypothetical protein
MVPSRALKGDGRTVNARRVDCQPEVATHVATLGARPGAREAHRAGRVSQRAGQGERLLDVAEFNHGRGLRADGAL